MRFSLFVALLFFFFTSTIHGSEPPREDTLEPVVVSDTRLRDVEQPASKLPGKVIVVTADEIKHLGAKTVQDVLRYQTGIVLYDTIGNGYQQTIDLRGFNGQPVPTTSVFVDGVRVNEPDFNTINFDLIPIEDIERIEILPGTATVFGRNALGGVINITTKRGRRDRLHFGADVSGGSFGQQKFGFTSDGPLPLGNLDYYFGATRELSHGFGEDSGGRVTRILGKLGYKLGESTDAALTYTHVQDHLKQVGSVAANILRIDRDDNSSPGDFYDGDLHQLVLNLRQKLLAGFSLAANGFYRHNDLDTFVNFDRGDGGCPHCVSRLFTTIRSGGSTLQLTHDGPIFERKNVFTFGAEYNRNNFIIKNTGNFFGKFLNKQATDEDVFGVYLSDSFNFFERIALQAGFRYDWDRLDFTDRVAPNLSGVKSYHRVSPKAGVVYTPLDQMTFSFSYSQGIRVPTVSEIFAQGPFGSNPNLVTMKSETFELGAKLQPVSWLEGSLALFYTPVKDEIFFTVTDPVNFIGFNNNISRTLRRGVEVSVKGRWRKMLDGFFNYTFTKATFETDVLLFSGQVRKGDELPLVPRHRASAGINWRPIEGLTLSLLGNYVGRQFLLNDEPNDGKRLADYFVLNSRIAYDFQYCTVHLSINNLTDRHYSTFGALGVGQPFRVAAPGINAIGGISFRY